MSEANDSTARLRVLEERCARLRSERDAWAAVGAEVCKADPAQPAPSPALAKSVLAGILTANASLRTERDRFRHDWARCTEHAAHQLGLLGKIYKAITGKSIFSDEDPSEDEVTAEVLSGVEALRAEAERLRAEVVRLRYELFAVAGNCVDGEPLPSCHLCGMADDFNDEGFERCQVTMRRIPRDESET